MIKVLQVMDGNQYGGVYEIMLRIGRNIKNIEFHYLTPIKVYESSKSYNLNIDRSTLQGRLIYNHRLYKFLKINKYDIVHISSGAFFFTFFSAITSRFAGIKRIVVHSRNTPNINSIKKILIKILNPLYRKITNVHLSCSKNAIKSLFTKEDDVIVIKNGIEINKYKFNEKIRNEYRKKLNIEDKIVYGHIGRFSKQKNHEFLINLFYELQKEQDAILLLVGDGELENNIKEQVKKLKIEDKVIFLGFRTDINNLLNCMDIFLFPSIYEGFGNVLIESQTNGLPTFVSNPITEEANISKNFHKTNSYDINEWKEEILKTKIDLNKRKYAYKDTINSGFDIKETTKQLERIYKDLI